MAKREERRAGPGGGEPGADRRGTPEPGPAGRGEGRQRRYTAEEKRGHLEALSRSRLSVPEYARTMGLTADTLYRWQKAYRAEGPRGLEPKRWGRPPGSGKGSRLAGPVQEAIAETKRRFPDFGFRKVRDYLRRFLHLKVSEGGVARVVKAMAPPPPAVKTPPRRRRRSEEPRRFERARPGQMWQSDITSYLLGRHHRRVYLTVFLDDCSRYVVSWNLQLHQRQELVTDCLLSGIERFGKPREVLTDQGRQYFAWRGKSDFQKLLAREGIQHVVARAHHPQTVGKCERLWKTVGEELIERARPEELEETRERLGHYFKHYNHFRPHQGLGGMTPADRFFGVEEAVRKEVEGAAAENALRMALGERPRSRSFLVGNFDGKPVTVRSGKDGIYIETDNGEVPAAAGGKDGDHDDHDGAEEEVPEEDAVCDAAEAGGGGAGALGAGGGGGEEEGARDGRGDAPVLAGEDEQGGGDGGAQGDGSPALAAQPDGGLGDGGGAPEAAPEPEGAAAVGGDVAPQEGGGAGEGTPPDAGAGENPRADAGPSGGRGPDEGGCATPGTGGTRSGDGSGRTGEGSGGSEGRSRGATA
jgi:transposase InsO family protein